MNTHFTRFVPTQTAHNTRKEERTTQHAAERPRMERGDTVGGAIETMKQVRERHRVFRVLSFLASK